MTHDRALLNSEQRKRRSQRIHRVAKQPSHAQFIYIAIPRCSLIDLNIVLLCGDFSGWLATSERLGPPSV